MDGGDISLKF